MKKLFLLLVFFISALSCDDNAYEKTRQQFPEGTYQSKGGHVFSICNKESSCYYTKEFHVVSNLDNTITITCSVRVNGIEKVVNVHNPHHIKEFSTSYR